MRPVYVILFLNLITLPAFFQTPTSDKTNSNVSNSGKTARISFPDKKQPVKVPKFSAPPVIDGKLDDEIWNSASIVKDFIQTSPGDNIDPSKETEVYIGYDERFLYIAFKCFDERDKIRATIAKRDEVFGEDNVRVYLDTYNDQRRAYILGFNPLGIQQDGILTEGQGADFSVDIVMESKGVIEDWGWSVEAKIPFKSLRYTAGKAKMWGFNAARTIDRLNDEFSSWVPIERGVAGFLSQFGKISGLDEIKTERTLEIVPSITLSETGTRKLDGSFANGPVKHDIGLNVKYTITPNVTLDLALNPDFAEIEADAPVVTANQRFPIFLNEKRPFFLEGKEIFERQGGNGFLSATQFFYSRTIVDPDVAAKLSGKIGKNSFGILLASDNAPGNFSAEERADHDKRIIFGELFGKNSVVGVVRLKRDVGKEHNVGMFLTTSNFVEKKNHVAGVDGRFKLNEKTVASFQVAGSASRGCFFDPSFDPITDGFTAGRNEQICLSTAGDDDRFRSSSEYFYRNGNGFSYYSGIDYTGRNRGWLLQASGTTRDFRSDTGFLRRTNINEFAVGGRISANPKPQATIIGKRLFSGGRMAYDWQGRLVSWSGFTNFNLNLQRNTFINFETGIGFERIFEEEFGRKRLTTRPDGGTFFGESERSTRNGFFGGFVRSSPTQVFAFDGYFFKNFNSFDFDFGAGRFTRVSPAALVDPNAPLDPGTGTQTEFGGEIEFKPTDPLRLSLDFNHVDLKRNDSGRTAFSTNIFSLRSTYQFSRFVFLRTRWDYDTLDRNARGQFVFGWNPNPGTAFYVGYNDDFIQPPFFRNERSFFIRASYLFRKSF